MFGSFLLCRQACILARRAGGNTTSWPIDVVFCGHMFMAPLAAIVARLRVLGSGFKCTGSTRGRNCRGCIDAPSKGLILITSVSRYTRRRLLEWVGIDPARVKVLPNTVDPRFQPGPKPDYLLDRHALYGKKMLLTVSRLASSERYKGHDR